jgi:hypothetical protein
LFDEEPLCTLAKGMPEKNARKRKLAGRSFAENETIIWPHGEARFETFSFYFGNRGITFSSG